MEAAKPPKTKVRSNYLSYVKDMLHAIHVRSLEQMIATRKRAFGDQGKGLVHTGANDLPRGSPEAQHFKALEEIVGNAWGYLTICEQELKEMPAPYLTKPRNVIAVLLST